MLLNGYSLSAVGYSGLICNPLPSCLSCGVCIPRAHQSALFSRPMLHWSCAGKEAAEAKAGGEDDTAKAEAAVQAVLSGKVAEIVFRSAADALPCTVAVWRRFLDALQPFSFPGIASIAEVSYFKALASVCSRQKGDAPLSPTACKLGVVTAKLVASFYHGSVAAFGTECSMTRSRTAFQARVLLAGHLRQPG